MSEEYTARQLTEEHQAGKWAVFLGEKQCTKAGGEKSAVSWARFMNRMAERP